MPGRRPWMGRPRRPWAFRCHGNRREQVRRDGSAVGGLHASAGREAGGPKSGAREAGRSYEACWTSRPPLGPMKASWIGVPMRSMCDRDEDERYALGLEASRFPWSFCGGTARSRRSRRVSQKSAGESPFRTAPSVRYVGYPMVVRELTAYLCKRPPAPATHSAGADHPACRSPQAEHRCSGNWTPWLCRRLGCYRRPARRLRSRADPRRPSRGTGLPSCSARWCCVRAEARTGQAAARPFGGPPDPARPRGAGHQHKPVHKSTPQRPRRPARRHYNQ